MVWVDKEFVNEAEKLEVDETPVVEGFEQLAVTELDEDIEEAVVEEEGDELVVEVDELVVVVVLEEPESAT